MPMPNYVRLLSSPPFRLILGKDRKCIYVPSGIAKNISPPLYELMNGDTRESHNGCATLEHVEPETFGAFWSFVNNGDYDLAVDERSMDIVNPYIARRQNTEESDYGETGPLGLTRTLTDRLTSTEDDLPEDEIDSELNLKLKIRTTEIPLEPSAAVMAEKYDFGQSRQERKQDKKNRWDAFCGLVDGLSPVIGSELWARHRTSATNYLKFHAKVYVFAHEYRIESLKDVCLRKLHEELRTFEVTSATNGDVIELLEFTYLNTTRLVDREDGLRMLVVQYVACVAKKLTRHINFRNLLDNNAEMASDLVHKLL